MVFYFVVDKHFHYDLVRQSEKHRKILQVGIVVHKLIYSLVHKELQMNVVYLIIYVIIIDLMNM